jgi:hypothetical protein
MHRAQVLIWFEPQMILHPSGFTDLRRSSGKQNIMKPPAKPRPNTAQNLQR